MRNKVGTSSYRPLKNGIIAEVMQLEDLEKSKLIFLFLFFFLVDHGGVPSSVVRSGA